MSHIKRKNHVVFSGGQSSSEVTRGQKLKSLLTQYFALGTMDIFHTQHIDAPYQAEDPYHLW